MNILLIGGTGFIGQFLVRELLKQDHIITIFSRDEHKQILLNRKLNNSQVDSILGDITKKIEIENNFDLIINLAACKHVATGEKNPRYTVEINILGIQNIIDFARNTPIFHMSTDKVINPNNVYGMTKYIAEKMLLNRSNSYIIRSGNIFGSRGSIVPILGIWDKKEFQVCNLSERYYVNIFDACKNIINYIRYPICKKCIIPAKRIKTFKLVQMMRPDLEIKFRNPYEGEKIYQELYEDEINTTKYQDLVYSDKEIMALIKEYHEKVRPKLIEV